MALNEIETGEEYERIFKAITSKSNKGEHTLIEKIVRNTTEHALGYGLLLSGYEGRASQASAPLPHGILRVMVGVLLGLKTGVSALLGTALLSLLWYAWKTPSEQDAIFSFFQFSGLVGRGFFS